MDSTNSRLRRGVLLAMACLVASAASLSAQTAADGRPLSLEQARQEALAGNANLRIAAASADMAAAAAGGTSAVYWPRIDFESGFVRSNDPVFVFGTKLRQGTFSEADFNPATLNTPDPINDWTNQVSLRWKVFSPADWTGQGAAAREAEAASWSATRTREATLTQTDILYREAQRAGAQLRASERAEAAAAANRDVFARRVDEGMLTRADLLQAEADYSFAVARRVDAERQDLDARRRLAVFLGGESAQLPVLTDSLVVRQPQPAADGAPAPFDPAERADLRALASARDAAEAGAKSATRSFLPEIGVFGNYAIHASDAFQNDGDNWTVGVGLTWNLFSGFSRSKDRQRAEAAQTIAETRYEEALRQANAELAAARDGLRAARQAVEASLAGRAAAEAGATLMTRRFEEGLATPADLLQAETRRAQAESRAIDAMAAFRMAEAQLRFVTTMHQNGYDR